MRSSVTGLPIPDNCSEVDMITFFHVIKILQLRDYTENILRISLTLRFKSLSSNAFSKASQASVAVSACITCDKQFVSIIKLILLNAFLYLLIGETESVTSHSE